MSNPGPIWFDGEDSDKWHPRCWWWSFPGYLRIILPINESVRPRVPTGGTSSRPDPEAIIFSILRGGLFGLFIACGLPAASLHGQDPAEPAAGGGRPNVFWDCQGFNCNDQYYRTEIDWVNWIRVPEESEIHVIMTSQSTGPGGREYIIDYIGRGSADGRTDQVRLQTLATDTQREQLDVVTNALGVGLARFAMAVGYTGLVRIESATRDGGLPEQGLVGNEAVNDPWNLWSFRVNANTRLEGESTQREIRLSGNLSASRVTPTWKTNFNSGIFYEDLEIEKSDGSLFEDDVLGWNFNPLIVYSVAEHWSVGLQGAMGRDRNINQRFFAQLTPTLEYSFFPYDEATRRSLTAFYTIGPGYRDYLEETIEGATEDTRLEQSFSVDFSQRQPWGNASIRAQYQIFLDDLSKYRASMNGNIQFRIVRGLSVNARGSIAWVKNQIYLSAEGVTDDEALLDLRQRATSFEYDVSIGFSLQFGSIYNNVVNNRFRGGERRRRF